MDTLENQRMYFHDEYDTFSIKALLTQGKLIITLHDFVGGAVYAKEYTQEDVGQHIHYKMDLFDVFEGFTSSKSGFIQKYEGEDQKKEFETSKLKIYKLGTAIQNQGYPCFKIDQGGKITVYLILIDKKLRKEKKYWSELTLYKTRDMSQEQIQIQKALVEKAALFQRIQKRMPVWNKNQSTILADVVDSLEQKQKTLKEVRNKLKQKDVFKCTNIQKVLFHQKSNKFELILGIKQFKIIVTLKDLTSNLTYLEIFGDENIIRRDSTSEIKISQFYRTFSRVQTIYSIKETQINPQEILDYQFGTIVYSKNQPLYKVQNDGKLTLYFNKTKACTNSSKVYSSIFPSQQELSGRLEIMYWPVLIYMITVVVFLVYFMKI